MKDQTTGASWIFFSLFNLFFDTRRYYLGSLEGRDGAPVVEATALKILANNLACKMGGASPNIRCLAWIHAIMFLTEFAAMPRIISSIIRASRLSNAMGNKWSIIPCAIPHDRTSCQDPQ